MFIRLPRKHCFKCREAAQILDKHISTLFRWHLHGVRGHRLRMVLIGGQRYVLRRDLIRFLRAINDEAAATPACETSKRRQEQIDQAEAELAAAGFGTASREDGGDNEHVPTAQYQ